MGFVLFTVFIVWPLLEIVMLVLIAGVIGWGWALLGLVSLSLLGVLVIRGTFRAAREIGTTTMNQATAGTVPADPDSLTGLGKQTADAGFRFLAGVLLVIPGYLTGVVGLLLLLPPVRSLARAAAGNAMLRRYPTMQATMTRVRIVSPTGDVVQGQVVRDETDQAPREGGPNPGQPPELPPTR